MANESKYASPNSAGTETDPVYLAGEGPNITAQMIIDLGNLSGINTGDEVSADYTTQGIAELATNAEITAGADDGKVITPCELAASQFGKNCIMTLLVDYATDLPVVGDGVGYIVIPSSVDGWDLIRFTAKTFTAGVTGATTFGLYNVTQTVEMLTVNASIASTETQATDATIDGDNCTVAVNDVLRIDEDAVSTTKPKGLLVTLEFRKIPTP